MVENAIKSADRYYRVLSMEPASSLGSADQMASAFKSVANAWIQQQKVGICSHLPKSAASTCMWSACSLQVITLIVPAC